jgi:prolyl oligopeptidase
MNISDVSFLAGFRCQWYQMISKENSMSKYSVLLAFSFMFLSCQSQPPKVDAYPDTPVKTVVDQYHGVSVSDPYRWLEDINSASVKDWALKQTSITQKYLNSINSRNSYKKKLTQIMSEAQTSYFGLKPLKKGFLAFKKEPKSKQAILIYLDSATDVSKPRVLVDPNKLDQSGALSISFISPSPSGNVVAVVFNESGKEVGDAFFYNIKTGEKLKNQIPRTHGPTAGGSLIWLNDQEILHTMYPSEKERPNQDTFFYQRLYKYDLKKDMSTYELGNDFPRISSIQTQKAPDSQKVLATVQYGDSGKFSYYMRSPTGQWKKILSHSHEVKEAFLGYNDQLFMITYKNSPKGRLLKVSANRPSFERAKTVVKEHSDSLVTDFYSGGVSLALKKHIVLLYQLGGPSELRVFDYNGKPVQLSGTKDVASVGGFKKTPDGQSFYYYQSSYTQPMTYHLMDMVEKKVTPTQIGQRTNADFSGVRVVREMAPSKDGTPVPVNIILPKGYKPGEARPLILTGYGGYGINITPSFQDSNSVWLGNGGILAVANLRGGGEFGKQWHEQGRLTKKQNVFDDFYAVSRHLIQRSYTTKNQLGIMGGSNGGLLMGAVMTQHPNDFGAVVSLVGIYDSLRSELSPNGEFNIPEFGTVKDKDQFNALYAYSPYHNAKKVEYPATLITTGINDNRVDPMHSLKMTAQLQAVNQSKQPILLRVDLDSGHGQGDSVDKRIAKLTDIYSFFDYHLNKTKN